MREGLGKKKNIHILTHIYIYITVEGAAKLCEHQKEKGREYGTVCDWCALHGAARRGWALLIV